MKLSPNDIYDRLNEKTGIDRELVKSISEAVFTELRSCMEDPKMLGYEVKDLGNFQLRQKLFLRTMKRVYMEDPKMRERYVNVMLAHEGLVPLIEEFKKARLEAKIKKSEYESKSRESSKDQS